MNTKRLTEARLAQIRAYIRTQAVSGEKSNDITIAMLQDMEMEVVRLWDTIKSMQPVIKKLSMLSKAVKEGDGE